MRLAAAFLRSDASRLTTEAQRAQRTAQSEERGKAEDRALIRPTRRIYSLRSAPFSVPSVPLWLALFDQKRNSSPAVTPCTQKSECATGRRAGRAGPTSVWDEPNPKAGDWLVLMTRSIWSVGRATLLT
jgi:hypothetical protein